MSASTNDTPTLGSLYPTPHSDIAIQDEGPDDPDPAAVAGQRFVELLRDLVQLWQAGPRDSREIMVFIVQANIVGKDVEGTIVRVRLRRRERVQGMFLLRLILPSSFLFLNRFSPARLDVGEEVVFGDKVSCARVQGTRQERAQYEIVQWLRGTAELDDAVVEDKLGNEIQDMDRGERRAVDEHRADRIEEDLERAEEGFAEQGVEEPSFKSCRKIGVKSCNSQGLVMCQMVGLKKHKSAVKYRLTMDLAEWFTIPIDRFMETYPECSTVWQPDGQIGKDSQ